MSTEASNPAAEQLLQTGLVGEAIDRGPVAIFVWDEWLRYVAVNQYAADLLGYSREELLALNGSDVVRGSEVTAHVQELVQRRRREGTVVMTHRDGHELVGRYAATETNVGGIPMYVSVVWVEES